MAGRGKTVAMLVWLLLLVVLMDVGELVDVIGVPPPVVVVVRVVAAPLLRVLEMVFVGVSVEHDRTERMVGVGDRGMTRGGRGGSGSVAWFRPCAVGE